MVLKSTSLASPAGSKEPERNWEVRKDHEGKGYLYVHGTEDPVERADAKAKEAEAAKSKPEPKKSSKKSKSKEEESEKEPEE